MAPLNAGAWQANAAARSEGADLVDAVLGGGARLPERPGVAGVSRLLSLGLGGLAAVEHPAWCAGLPEAQRSDLQAQRHLVGLRGVLLQETARSVRERLARAGVPSVLLKGAALVASGVYPEPGARFMSDVDLLVPVHEAEAAIGVLLRAGFTPWTAAPEATLGWSDAATFSRPGPAPGLDSTVDLHWRVGRGGMRFGAPGLETKLLARADPTTGQPRSEPHFVHLVEHLLRHLRVRPHHAGFADLVRLAPRVADWEEVAELARRGPLAGGGAALLEAIRVHYGAPVPPGTPLAVDAVAAREWSRMGVLPATAPRTRLGGLRRRWRWAGGGRSAASEFAATLLPDAFWLRARYPEVPRALRLPTFWAHAAAWGAGIARSPASPNQQGEASPLRRIFGPSARPDFTARSAVDTPRGGE